MEGGVSAEAGAATHLWWIVGDDLLYESIKRLTCKGAFYYVLLVLLRKYNRIDQFTPEACLKLFQCKRWKN